MLPESFESFIPKFYTRDAKLTAFADKMDSIIADLKSDTLGLNDLITPEKIPADLIVELGYLLNAGINEQDDERTRRQKVQGAVDGHKQRGSFSLDAKPKIDNIAGGNSVIITGTNEDDAIIPGDGLTPAAAYWSAIGADGIDDELGFVILTDGTEIYIAGNVYIDVDNAALGAADQAELELEMQDIVPAYYFVHFGHIVAGDFVEYFVMG